MKWVGLVEPTNIKIIAHIIIVIFVPLSEAQVPLHWDCLAKSPSGYVQTVAIFLKNEIPW